MSRLGKPCMFWIDIVLLGPINTHVRPPCCVDNFSTPSIIGHWLPWSLSRMKPTIISHDHQLCSILIPEACDLTHYHLDETHICSLNWLLALPFPHDNVSSSLFILACIHLHTPSSYENHTTSLNIPQTKLLNSNQHYDTCVGNSMMFNGAKIRFVGN